MSTIGVLKSKRYEKFQVGAIAFEGAAAARPALPGDTVTLVGGKVAVVEKRAEHKNIVGVLEMASKTKYGFTARGAPIYLFSPYDESYPPFYVGSTHEDKSKNVLALVDLEHWDASANCPRGSCRQILGPCGDLAAEEEALLWAVRRNPWKASAKYPKLAPPLPPNEGGVKCLGKTFHVDPEGCRDIDDAITLAKDGDIITLKIHIADVGSYLLTNPWLLEAAERGQTVYKDGKVVGGMFPPQVEEAFSLLPFQPRMTLTLKLVFEDCDGFIFVKDKRWQQEEIVVEESYTYETFKMSDHVELLKEVCDALAHEDLPDDPHAWIEQLMLTYNMEFAAVLKERGLGVLRRHSAPRWELLSQLEGMRLNIPQHLAYASGEYCEATATDVSHWGLGLISYCHASSPIRRWADCLNQLCMLHLLFHPDYQPPIADVSALNASAKEIKRYERDLFFLRTLLTAKKGEQLSVRAIILANIDVNSKLKLWVDSWKRILTVTPPVNGWEFEPGVGMKMNLKFFLDPTKRNWKRRLVYRLLPELVVDKVEEKEEDDAQSAFELDDSASGKIEEAEGLNTHCTPNDNSPSH